MILHMKDHVEGKPQPKMWMYSAHDTTIANLLNTLRVFELQNPPYFSAVLMELRADTSGNHHVYVSVIWWYLYNVNVVSPVCIINKVQ